ncbi:protein of unknown function [Moritella yayanosii]|uniref:Uncharacterized protein n=1 Tax=Moritella yayanosii TaxID=69539 RepID=A0A330LM42_9GAMM|nr:protein of unknown function [Moritella yayanosii]
MCSLLFDMLVLTNKKQIASNSRLIDKINYYIFIQQLLHSTETTSSCIDAITTLFFNH